MTNDSDQCCGDISSGAFTKAAKNAWEHIGADRLEDIGIAIAKCYEFEY